MQIWTGLMIAGLVCLSGIAKASEISELSGNWRTVRHGAEIRIADCGDGSPCGYLVSVSDDVKDGHDQDVRNKKPELRHRSLNGLPILWGYSRNQDSWRKGKLYNPETGQTFSSSLALISEDRLRVKGCLGPFCRQQTWTRIRSSETSLLESKINE